MDYWSNGVMAKKEKNPILQYSSTPILHYLDEVG
jgi:hypothetical protein